MPAPGPRNPEVTTGRKRVEPSSSQEKQPAAAKQCRSAYSVEQTRWIVAERLKLQAFFDDKLHKNEQLWDRIHAEYKVKWEEDREKTSIREKYEREQNMFRSFCRLRATFRAGRTSGLSSDDQEKALYKLRGGAHELFMENRFHERPLCKPPSLFHGGNAESQARANLANDSAGLSQSPAKSTASMSDSEKSAAETADTKINVDDSEREKDLGNTHCDRSTWLAGSDKAKKHGESQKKRGRKGISDFVDNIENMLTNAIEKMGEQRRAEAKAQAEERDKDRQLFMETIKLMMNKE